MRRRLATPGNDGAADGGDRSHRTARHPDPAGRHDPGQLRRSPALLLAGRYEGRRRDRQRRGWLLRRDDGWGWCRAEGLRRSACPGRTGRDRTGQVWVLTPTTLRQPGERAGDDSAPSARNSTLERLVLLA